MPIDLENPAAVNRFKKRLLTWYAANHRLLPWRKTRDPYHIWVSEIMLQQTRVAAVLEHYRNFLRRFPTIRKLAAAHESDVLAAWSGLGYYRRARMMHRAAQVLAARHNAKLPSSATQLQELPGIGRYTAHAIASIAFGEAVAVVDGNVERVLTRLLAKRLSAPELWKHAQLLLDLQRPGDFNQAMMELGATVCLPANPQCGRCPVRRSCSWTCSRQPSRIPSQRLRRSASLLLVQQRGAVRLRQRSSHESLMPGMWELPQLAGKAVGLPLLTVKHSITTTDWTIHVFTSERAPARVKGRWVALSAISSLPLTGLTRKILRRLELLQ